MESVVATPPLDGEVELELELEGEAEAEAEAEVEVEVEVEVEESKTSCWQSVHTAAGCHDPEKCARNQKPGADSLRARENIREHAELTGRDD